MTKLLAGFGLWHASLLGLYFLATVGCHWATYDIAVFSLVEVLAAFWWTGIFVMSAALVLQFGSRRRGAGRPQDSDFLGSVILGVTAWACLAVIGLGIPLLQVETCL